MKKEIKEKKKKLEKRYSDYLFEVIQFLSKQNLSKYSFYEMRDLAIEEIYQGQVDGTNPDHIFHHGYDTFFTKRINKLPKKGIIEKISSILFVFFLLLTVLMLAVYFYRFTSNINTFMSKGIYLYVSPSNLASMFAYGFLGSIVSILLQKIDKKTKYASLGVTAGIGIAVVLSLFAIGANISVIWKLNMIVISLIGIGLSIGCFVLENAISKRKCLPKNDTKQ